LSFSKALLTYISLTNSLDHYTHRGGTGSGSDKETRITTHILGQQSLIDITLVTIIYLLSLIVRV